MVCKKHIFTRKTENNEYVNVGTRKCVSNC